MVRRLEDDVAMVECMRRDGGACVISLRCRLKGIVSKALEAFLSVFDGHTLADIVENRTALAELLDLRGSSRTA
jgi:Rrf2 family nitric oxide-sensitive transcriptional repressor